MNVMIIDEKIEDLGIPFNDQFIFYFLVGVNLEVEISCSIYCSPTISECLS